MNLNTSINAIKANSPCKSSFSILLLSMLTKEQRTAIDSKLSDDRKCVLALKALTKEQKAKKFPLTYILDTLNIENTLWAFRTLDSDQKEDGQIIARTFAIECAERVLPIFEAKYPDDKRPRICLEVTKRYINGEASLDELSKATLTAATHATYAATCADEAIYAYAAFYAATCAYADATYAPAYAYAATGDYSEEETTWQKDRLRELLS